jgi:sterol desaturase/sphingolipid hydroxylase (fatty acid hydroxylase superfamily)
LTAGGLSLLTSIYLGLFAGGFAFFWLWEGGSPLRPFADDRARRRHVLRNLGVLLSVILVADIVYGTFVLRVGAHLLDPPSGLLSPLALPTWALVVVAFVAVDFYEYAFHRLAHRWRPLWLMHRVHHSDPHVDVSTGARQHPLEAALIVSGRLPIYLALGLPLWIEVVRVIVANTVLFAQHANVAFPRAVEALRPVLMTPAVHRQHHSPDQPLIDRNFGQFFTLWDRLFGTYAEPEGEAPAAYGLRPLRAERWQTVAGILLTPFRSEPPSGPA